jgi:hypothetical protein
MQQNHDIPKFNFRGVSMEKYLPLGSVVILNGGTKKIMINGRRQIAVDTGKIFDYVACFYPEGNISEEYTFLFDHDNIASIIFEGYSDAEDQSFQMILKDKIYGTKDK